MRILAIDFGMKRIGIAISDPLKIIASPLKMIYAQQSLEKTVDHLIQEIKELHSCEKILVGLPLHLNGKESEMSQIARSFGSLLHQKTNLPVEFVDERLTSKGTEILLKEQNLTRKQRAKKVDVGSACLILQTYLDQVSLLCSAKT